MWGLLLRASTAAVDKPQLLHVMNHFAEAFRENNVVHAYIVHSDDGIDEISPFAKTNIVELKDAILSEKDRFIRS